jgi:ATP-dependent RNA helicase DDX23/PRP28
VGGLSIEQQGVAMRSGCEIIIATPGRLYDCIERRYLVLNQCNYVVLDEADRMIDAGFEPQITKIFNTMPSTNIRPEDPEMEAKFRQEKRDLVYRQTIMFSATMPLQVELLAKKFLRNPIFLAVGDRAGAASTNVTQRVEWMGSDNQKKTRLLEILNEDLAPFIIFMNAKKACDSLSRYLTQAGFKSTVVHGGKIQAQREANLAGFKAGEYDVLVATDVIGRGIDISGVEQVINYELPKTIDKYTHRIGRTGRAGRKGVATSFLTNEDTDIMFDLKNMLISSHNLVPLELSRHEGAKNPPGTISQRGGHGGGRGGGAPSFARKGVIYAR